MVTTPFPQIRGSVGACTEDTWTATSAPPDARTGHTAVWTGSEMIVWGGFRNIVPYTTFNTGGRYNPSTDSWVATRTTNAPAGRFSHTVVWTGSEMIVWGGGDGFNVLNSGGRYNPGTDSWTATSTANAASPRSGHTAVWTGSQMIVWGGPYLNTGGRYNPGTNSWSATSTTNAPAGRYGHTAVWTGSQMIVWAASMTPATTRIPVADTIQSRTAGQLRVQLMLRLLERITQPCGLGLP
jgi:N-acetylneuraminic acid mutarotase